MKQEPKHVRDSRTVEEIAINGLEAGSEGGGKK